LAVDITDAHIGGFNIREVLYPSAMVSQRTKYWAAQVRALVTDDVKVTERYNAEDVAVILPSEDNTKEERASLIRSLERGGCTVTSTTNDSYIYVDGTESELDWPHDDSVNYNK